MDEAGFRAANAELTGKQMFLADLSVASVHGVPTIAAIWMRWSESTPEAAAQAQKLVFLRQTPAEVQAKYMELSKAGSQLTAIDAYDVDGTTYFATAFLAPDQKPMQFVGAFLAEKDAADFRTEAQSKGMSYVQSRYRVQDGRVTPISNRADFSLYYLGYFLLGGLLAWLATRPIRRRALAWARSRSVAAAVSAS